MQPTLQNVEQMALFAGRILMAHYGKQHQVQHKGRIDIVTEVDKQSEEFLVKTIQDKFPGHSILSEEIGQLQGVPEHCWYVDPLDGTNNYERGIPLFGVLIAYAHQGQLQLGVIYEPVHKLLYTAERSKGAYKNGERIRVSDTHTLINAVLSTGFPLNPQPQEDNNFNNFVHMSKKVRSVRRFGSTAINLSYTASGLLDGYWEVGSKPWDIAAGTLLIKEAGGVVTDLRGEEDYFKPPYAIVAGNEVLQPLLLKELRLSRTAQGFDQQQYNQELESNHKPGAAKNRTGRKTK